METKNLAIICVAVIVCVAIIAAAIVMVNNNSNNNSDDVVVANDTNQSDSSVNESSGNSDDSSSAELGSRENPKTEADYVSGNSGDPNPNYGDYYVLDGGLFRDDNEYLGGAGTYTFISGDNIDGSHSYITGVWYGKCKDHGWVELNSDKHCPICAEKGMDARVYKGTTYQA